MTLLHVLLERSRPLAERRAGSLKSPPVLYTVSEGRPGPPSGSWSMMSNRESPRMGSFRWRTLPVIVLVAILVALPVFVAQPAGTASRPTSDPLTTPAGGARPEGFAPGPPALPPTLGTYPVALSPTLPPTVTGVSIIARAKTGDNPATPAFDVADGDIYIPDFGSIFLGGNNVTIVSGASHQVLANLAVGDDPISAVYDPGDSDVYIMNFGISMNLTVLHGTSIIGWIPVGDSPNGGVYNPTNGDLYVTNTASGNVSVISGTTVVTSIKVGGNPAPPTYDSINNEVYVPNTGSNTVSVIKGTTVIGTVNVGLQPSRAAFDSTNGHIYVPNTGGSNVSVIAGTTLLGNLTTGSAPWSATFDSANGNVYVPCTGSNQLSVIANNQSVTNLSVGDTPREAIYDDATGLVYLTNWASNNVSAINGTRVVASIDVGLAPYDGVDDTVTGQTYIDVYDSDNVTVIGDNMSAYSVTFNETGLPAGTEWTAQLGSTAILDTNSSITFSSPNGTFNYSIWPIANFEVNGSGQVTVAGNSTVVNVTFRELFGVDFSELGLPNGTTWNVTVDAVAQNFTAPWANFSEPNGSYRYSILPIPGYSTRWNGNVTVIGLPVKVSVVFTEVTYLVTFSIKGLPAGTPWTVVVGSTPLSTSSPQISRSEPNGSYVYDFQPIAGYQTPAQGAVNVQGTGASVVGTYFELFAVHFVETGLPGGTAWSVSIGAATNRSTSTSIGFALTNGTFAYSVTAPSGFRVTPTGNVTVNGSGPTVTVAFVEVFLATFEEAGLPGGTPWGVTIGETTNRSTSPEISLVESNGTYDYAVGTVLGYDAYGPANVVINGLGVMVSIRFVAIFPVNFEETGLPGGLSWAVTFEGNSTRSSASTIGFLSANGTHPYTIAAIPGLRTFWSGTVNVHGGPATVNVGFVPNTYTVTFEETGLVANASWSVTLNGSTKSTDGSSLSFLEVNGSYPYTVDPVLGYSGGLSGSVAVKGADPAPVSVAYVPAGKTSTGFGGLTTLELGAGVAAAVVVIAVALLLLRRRGGSAQREEAPTSNSPAATPTSETVSPPTNAPTEPPSSG
jgi:YVTN family beta-propeller protein